MRVRVCGQVTWSPKYISSGYFGVVVQPKVQLYMPVTFGFLLVREASPIAPPALFLVLALKLVLL